MYICNIHYPIAIRLSKWEKLNLKVLTPAVYIEDFLIISRAFQKPVAYIQSISEAVAFPLEWKCRCRTKFGNTVISDLC